MDSRSPRDNALSRHNLGQSVFNSKDPTSAGPKITRVIRYISAANGFLIKNQNINISHNIF